MIPRSLRPIRLLTLAATALLLSWAAFAAEPPAKADKPPRGQRVFVAGHSFHMMISAPLGEMAKAGGITDHKLAGIQSIGGSRVTQHWDKPDEENKAKKAIKAGEVDVLTLSPHLKIPDEGIDKFTELALEHNPNARILVQASWMLFDSPDNNRSTFKNDQRDDAKIDALRKAAEPWYVAIREQAQSLNDKYKEKHKRQVVYVVPVGQAVIALREKVIAGKVPGITKQSELFTDPIGHVKAPVAVLNAYCHYAVIYGRSPVGLPVPAALKGKVMGADDEKLNQLLQEIAWETVTSQPLTGVKK